MKPKPKTTKRDKLQSEAAIKRVIEKWPLIFVQHDYAKPVLTFWSLKKVKGEMLDIDREVATIDLRKLIKRRAPLTGVTKRLKKAIRPGRSK